MAKASSIVIGIRSHLVCLDASTGQELWRTKLKGSQWVTVASLGDRVFGGAAGELFCLARDTGAHLWHNKLKGLGFGILALAASSRSTSELMVGIKGHVLSIDAATGEERWRTKLPVRMASAVILTHHGDDQSVLAGCSGELCCLDRASGQVLWQSPLKGLGLGLVGLEGTDSATAAAMAQAQAAAAAAAAS